MKFYYNRILTTSLLLGFIFICQGFTGKTIQNDKPENLKILPKDISDEQLDKIMKGFSKSLGVKCNFCHQKNEGEGKPKFNFASDSKYEKGIAREMMKMTDEINSKYIDKIGEGNFTRISCVTCHMGRPHPVVSADSLQNAPAIPVQVIDTVKH